MSETRGKSKRSVLKKNTIDIDSLIESDETFGFIVGYTSNGAAYGLTHEEWDEIKAESVDVKTHTDDLDISF